MAITDFDLSNRRALVTGGSDGLGRQFAEALLDAGAEVVICGRRKDSLDSTVKELSERYSGISSMVCDVTEQDQVSKLATDLGGIDILVNNAGLAHRAKWDVEQSEEWRKIMVLNVEAPFWLSQKFLPGMIEKMGKGNQHRLHLWNRIFGFKALPRIRRRHALIFFKQTWVDWFNKIFIISSRRNWRYCKCNLSGLL